MVPSPVRLRERPAELRIRGQRLAFWVRGRGQRVLLLHGLGATSHIWRRVAQRLSGFQTIAVDLPGCGRSAMGPPSTSIAEVATLVDALMAELGEDPYAVAGHSLGGAVALELARTRPARITAAGLINAVVRPSPLVTVAAMPGFGDTLFRVAALLPPSRLSTRLYLMGIFGRARRVTSEVVDDYLAAAAGPDYFQRLLSGLRGLATWSAGERLSKLSVPIAVVWGARDPLFPLAEGRRLAAALPGSRLHVLAQCGHCPPEESPEEVAEILRLHFASAVGPHAPAEPSGSLRPPPKEESRCPSGSE